jgi:hypothetical protein
MDPAVVSLSVQLADTAIRNTAATVADKIAAAKARKRDQETIAELEEIISSLISDKNDLVRIAQAYEQELAGHRISQSDVQYIADNVIPILRSLAAAASEDDADSDLEQQVEALASIVSAETVNILQLVGFNFRRAIGEPLTQLVAQLILSKAPPEDGHNNELQALQIKREMAYISLAQDAKAFARLKELSNRSALLPNMSAPLGARPEALGRADTPCRPCHPT